ncbi:MAG: RND family efflux transporter MFP subunit [Paracoccaceae bacterium]|jgi:RND family efflux transporter MFP subunit
MIRYQGNSMRRFMKALAVVLVTASAAGAEQSIVVEQQQITEWKSVFGRVEVRDRVPARSRLGGTLVTLAVQEGAQVSTGQVLAVVDDEKLRIQLEAIDAQIQALNAQLDNAKTELKRGEDLLQRGVTTVQRLDALRTQVDVLDSQMEAASADRRVVEQRATEGAVLAPISGIVLQVPVTTGAVVLPGEVIAEIGGGGVFLRLAVPERHAGHLRQGAEIVIDREDGSRIGRLDKIYPQIENGRVIADVEVSGLDDLLVDARVLVRLPVGVTSALMIPASAPRTRFGLDFVPVIEGNDVVLRSVVLGQHSLIDDVDMVQVLSGLKVGDSVVLNHD